MAKPLVSHEVGVRGLRTDTPFALVAEDNRAYADAIITLLQDDEKAMELSRNACAFMKEYKEKNTRALQGILEDKKD